MDTGNDVVSIINKLRIVDGVLAAFVGTQIIWLLSQHHKVRIEKNIGALSLLVYQFGMFLLLSASPFHIRSAGFKDYLDDQGIASGYTEVLFNVISSIKLNLFLWLLYKRSLPIFERGDYSSFNAKYSLHLVRVISFFFCGAMILGIVYGFVEKPASDVLASIFSTLNWYSIGAFLMTIFELYYFWHLTRILRGVTSKSGNKQEGMVTAKLTRYGMSCVTFFILAEFCSIGLAFLDKTYGLTLIEMAMEILLWLSFSSLSAMSLIVENQASKKHIVKDGNPKTQQPNSNATNIVTGQIQTHEFEDANQPNLNILKD